MQMTKIVPFAGNNFKKENPLSVRAANIFLVANASKPGCGTKILRKLALSADNLFLMNPPKRNGMI